jgi:heme/copper-type cytochrome/quinol oxidase subunit 4
MPLLAMAQSTPLGSASTPTGSASTPTGIGFAGIVTNIINFFNNSVIPLIYALAFVFFLIGIVRYFFIEGGEEGQTKGKQFVLYGLIGLVVLFSVWGILNIMLATLNSLGGTGT